MKLVLDKNTDISKLTVDDINNLLISKLQDYIIANKDIPLQQKPNEFQYNDNQIKRASNIEDQLEQIELQQETKIDRQLYTVAENIVLSYFSLDNEKFMAVLDRVNAWGLELTLHEFIMSYYLFTKTNKYIRQFVLLHLDKLIKMTSAMIEKQLLTKLNLYNFSTNDVALKNLKQQLVEKEKELQKVQPSDLVIDRQNQVVDTDKVAQMKLDILNDLKKQHPELED